MNEMTRMEDEMPRMSRQEKTRAVAETIVVALCNLNPRSIKHYLDYYHDAKRPDGRPLYPIGEIDDLREVCRQVYRERTRGAE